MPSQKKDKISSKKDKENQKDDYLNSNNKSLLLYWWRFLINFQQIKEKDS